MVSRYITQPAEQPAQHDCVHTLARWCVQQQCYVTHRLACKKDQRNLVSRRTQQKAQSTTSSGAVNTRGKQLFQGSFTEDTTGQSPHKGSRFVHTGHNRSTILTQVQGLFTQDTTGQSSHKGSRFVHTGHNRSVTTQRFKVCSHRTQQVSHHTKVQGSFTQDTIRSTIPHKDSRFLATGHNRSTILTKVQGSFTQDTTGHPSSQRFKVRSHRTQQVNHHHKGSRFVHTGHNRSVITQRFKVRSHRTQQINHPHKGSRFVHTGHNRSTITQRIKICSHRTQQVYHPHKGKTCTGTIQGLTNTVTGHRPLLHWNDSGFDKHSDRPLSTPALE
ncbi:uncharacterized protein LOC143300322 [Babylonia areolata]|uniref:uncharacterized protein LOC143300322 n=1 Tax=Babylonia areolata TaxID=304850 RepID=UPI003FD2408F